ncbi:proteoglycan 4-like isoform X2 [Limulus polyphemus]|uniref:Proteoglycan 4-like isoform X2 n=1 Tax=Limulus polyphemus TaxID=6850 RepID=A0ABM1TEI0_LIMPO|nr:proteoglycan 4-like isoform X2 [Limulus polyphemus]
MNMKKSTKEDVQIPTEATPAVITEPSKPTRPVKPSAPLEEGPEVTPAVGVKPARKRREPSSEFELEELEPVVQRPKRPRRRLYDLNITISREEMRSGMATANERLTHPIELPLLQETPQEMFARPGSYIGSEILLRFWKNLKTQTESKDPAAPGTYIVREESSPSEESEQGIPRAEEPTGLKEPAISLEEMALEVERLRERSAQEDSSLLKTPASLQDITVITEAQDISGKTPTEQISPEAFAEVPFMLPIAEEMESQLEKEPEPVEKTLPLQPEPICEVSPPRTPPPPSPSPERSPSPSKEKLKLILQQAMTVTKTPGVITFKALISPKINSRLYASNTFYKLLEFHKIGVVHLKQEFPYGDIFIIQLY